MAVGIDPSRSAIQIAILSPDGVKPREHRLPLVPASVKAVEALLEGQEAVVSIEGAPSMGYCFLLELLNQGHDVREVNPRVSKSFRELLSEDHSDRKDAFGLARAALLLPNLPRIAISVEQAAAKRLSRLRQRLVQDQTAYLNRLHACLMESYGSAYKGLFPKLLSKRALRFFQKYPTINDALGQETTVQGYLSHDACQKLKEAGTWVEGLYLQMLRGEVQVLSEQLLNLLERIREVEQQMAALPLGDRREVLTSMPGMGITLAVTILGETGQVSRFRSSDAYAAYCGLAPATWQSGGSQVYAKGRSRFNRRLRRAFLLLAFTQLRVNHKSRDYYWRKRKEGKSHWTALRCLARHLCRIVFRMLTEGQPYESTLPDKVRVLSKSVPPATSPKTTQHPGLNTRSHPPRRYRRKVPIFHDGP